jgi:hypothetical protein
MRSVRFLPLVLALGLATSGPACAPRRACVPHEVATSRNLIDLSLPPDAHVPVDPGVIREVAEEFRLRGAARSPKGARPYHFLALSGGGLYGAFGVGVLLGWTETGTRPQFDVVTGVSIGGLIATFAFLGPEYDHVLRQYTDGVRRSEVYRHRPLLVIPFADAALSSAPLARGIEEAITPRVLCEVARAHAAGRRLYVGTSNLDTRRLVIWDMGAIATRGDAEALALYRAVVLASCSVPGALPPVRIPVEVDGRRYEELHGDGGANDSVIFQPFMLADVNRAAGRPGAWAPAGSTLYVLDNGKLYADPKCVKPRILPEVNAAARSLLYGKTRDELDRIYLKCLETGVDFRLTAIPQDLPVGVSGSLYVSREEQRRMVAAGYAAGRVAPHGPGWREFPPGTDPSEQVLPRAGTRFVTGQGSPPGQAPGCRP